MIELAFNESAAGALKFAKSMKHGDILQGAIAVFGGTAKERREAKKPRVWTGLTMEGGSGDVAPLSLYMDIGDISDTLDTDAGMPGRKKALDDLFAEYLGVSDEIWKANQITLSRLEEAKKTREPVRMWICNGNPSELCGLYFICRLFADTAVPLSAVRIPEQVEKDGCIVSYRGTGDVNAEDMGRYAGYEEPVSGLQRIVFSNSWSDLVRENAPLRALVNGSLMSVPEDFYDFALRANMPDGKFRIAHLIGRTLNHTPGVGDQWLYLRVESMLKSGELFMVSAAEGDHHYSAVVQRNPGR